MSNATAPMAPSVPLDLSTTYGALLIGSYLGCMLWGAQILQTAWYYLNFPNDPLHMKIFVGVINAVSSLDITFEILSLWFGAITTSGEPPNVFTNPYLFYRIPTFAVVVFLAQLFYVFRIYKFATSKLIRYGVPCLLVPLICFQIIGNSYVAANWLKLSVAGRHPGADITALELSVQSKVTKIILPIYGSACATELSISIVMCGLLFQRRTGLGSTDRLLMNLAVTSFNTGIWPAIVALLIVILTKTTSQTAFIYAAPTYIASALYVNSVLCNLNVRQFFRKQERSSTSKKMSTLVFSSKKNSAKRSWEHDSPSNTRSDGDTVPDISFDHPKTIDSGVYELQTKNSSHLASSNTYTSSRGMETEGTGSSGTV